MPQLAFYRRISKWVAPDGTLLIVGHLHGPHTTSHEPGAQHRHQNNGDHPPEEASVALRDITADLDVSQWSIVTAEEHVRRTTNGAGRSVELHDVVVRALRRG